MNIRPCLLGGLVPVPWISYRIRDGYAEVEHLFKGKRVLLLQRANPSCEHPSFVSRVLGVGRIEITGESGEKMIWENVRDAQHVRDTLERASRGLPIDEAELSQAERSSSPSELVGTPVRFAAPGDLAAHQVFFESMGHNLWPPEQIDSLSGTEHWIEVACWDAGHDTPALVKASGQKRIAPKIVGWGRAPYDLFVSCGFEDLKVYSTSTIRSTPSASHVQPDDYGHAYRYFVSPEGHYVLLQGQFTNNAYTTVFDRSCQQIAKWVGQDHWGCKYISDYGWRSHRRFSPWRPGSTHLGIVEDGAEFRVIDISEPRFRDAWKQFWKPKEFFKHIPSVCRIRFDTLGALDKKILSYQWHPSGAYIAVNTCRQDDGGQRIHIVHLETETIVKTIPENSHLLGWSPGGRYLLFERIGGMDGNNTELAVWDAHDWRSNHSDEAAVFDEAWARNAIFGNRYGFLSCDGKRILDRHERGLAVFSAVRKSNRIVNGAVLSTIPNVAEPVHACWSPLDPGRFAVLDSHSKLRAYLIRG